MKILVTGGAGFIGSHLVHHLLKLKTVHKLINLDKLTYAGHLENVKDCKQDKRYQFVKGDICNPALVNRLMRQVDHVIHLAAETHVDRSIHSAAPFLQTNVIGTQTLLEGAKAAQIKRFLHVSTDEVYGSIARGHATEKSPLIPSSPYSASKAASDHLALSYYTTYGLPVLVTRAANNYGSYQYPEKFLPLFITRCLNNAPLPLYGNGLNVREWLHVDDHCQALITVLLKGKIGEVYNVGTEVGHSNKEVVERLLSLLGKPKQLIQYVPDRLGHDKRYAMSISKIKHQLGWKPKINFEDGFESLIAWYIENRSWWEEILNYSSSYKRYIQKQYRFKH